MIAIAVLLHPMGGVIIEFWEWNPCWQTNEDGSWLKNDRMFSPCNSLGSTHQLPFFLAAMPEVMAIAKTFGELRHGGGPGGSSSDPGRVKPGYNIVNLFERRAA